MSLGYSIEALQHTGNTADTAQAAVLAGVLAARGGRDIPLPEGNEVGCGNDQALNLFLGASATMELLDDSDNNTEALTTEELDEQSRNRYELSNAAKVALHPYYIAASRKVPLAVDNPRGFGGRIKSGTESLNWTATNRVNVVRQNTYDWAPTSTFYEPMTTSTDMVVDYQFAPTGNLAVSLAAKVHQEGLKPSRNDPNVVITFEDQAATGVLFSRGSADLIHSNLEMLPSWFKNVMEFDAMLDPSSLSLNLKLTAPFCSGRGPASNATYDYDPVADKFYPNSFKDKNFKDASMPSELTREQFVELLQLVTAKAFPTKQKA